jgi:pre-mRNA branch site protein p14
MLSRDKVSRLPPSVTRAIYVRNLPYKITTEEMFELFGKYGPIRQIRLGDAKETKGTAFIVYEDIFDAKSAVEHLSGFNVLGRYLVVLYYQPSKFSKNSTHAMTSETLSDEAQLVMATKYFEESDVTEQQQG